MENKHGKRPGPSRRRERDIRIVQENQGEREDRGETDGMEKCDGLDDSGGLEEGAAIPPSWLEQGEAFRHRLVRMARHWHKWARRQDISCYRLYDRDISNIPLAIDWYEGRLHVAEFAKTTGRPRPSQSRWIEFMIATAADALDVPMTSVFVKRRERMPGRQQYSRQDSVGQCFNVQESGLTFRVNLSDYLDTGLFLDHRQTRGMIREQSQGKRFLNLFGYTGAFSVYAAAGGAESTTTVDLSNTYLDWARENMRLNGLGGAVHEFVRDDATAYLHFRAKRHGEPFDLAVVDPPTFSRSKRTPIAWDVQRDHLELLELLMRQMTHLGRVYFSTNLRGFRLHDSVASLATVREITRQTVPPDFRNNPSHRCWLLTRSAR